MKKPDRKKRLLQAKHKLETIRTTIEEESYTQGKTDYHLNKIKKLLEAKK